MKQKQRAGGGGGSTHMVMRVQVRSHAASAALHHWEEVRRSCLWMKLDRPLWRRFASWCRNTGSEPRCFTTNVVWRPDSALPAPCRVWDTEAKKHTKSKKRERETLRDSISFTIHKQRPALYLWLTLQKLPRLLRIPGEDITAHLGHLVSGSQCLQRLRTAECGRTQRDYASLFYPAARSDHTETHTCTETFTNVCTQPQTNPVVLVPTHSNLSWICAKW